MKETFERGSLIVFTCGNYDDYRFEQITVVNVPFNMRLLSEKWESECVSDVYYDEDIVIFDSAGWPKGKKTVKVKSDYFKDVKINLHEWLCNEGYIERLDFTEVHQNDDWVRPE